MYADDSYVICEADTKEELQARLETVINKHVIWLRQLGMVVNSSKTELLFFNKIEDVMNITIEGNVLASARSMNVLGIWFDERMSWDVHLSKATLGCQRLKAALRCLKTKLNRSEFLKVITSHYYSRLYYGSEVWFWCLNSKSRGAISPIHYFPLRLAFDDFKRKYSRKELNSLASRANPFELNDYKIAKLLISILSNTDPFVLFNELLSHCVVETRKEFNPSFLDMSRTRIGRQSLANRVNIISKQIKFEWLGKTFTKDSLRKSLKSSFFSYFIAPIKPSSTKAVSIAQPTTVF